MPEPARHSVALRRLLAGIRVIPVVTLARVEQAVPLARALAAGGLPIIEVTLRSPVAVDAIAVIAREVPEVTVGAGSLRRPAQIIEAQAAGARFGVSPGHTAALLDAGAAEVVLSRGAAPCQIGAAGTQEIVEVPARQNVNLRDTTAAGDAFNAAYLLARLRGSAIREAATAGHALAARVIQTPGALLPREKQDA